MVESQEFDKLNLNEGDISSPPSLDSISKTQFSINDFKIEREVGKGAYAKLYVATHISRNKQYALKCIDKKMMAKEDKLYQVYVELELLQSLDCPFIAKAYGGFEENDKLFIVMDYYDSGDLFDFIRLNSNFIYLIVQNQLRLMQ